MVSVNFSGVVRRKNINDFGKIVGLFNDIMNKITGRVCNDVDDFIVNYYMRLIAAKEFPPSDSNYAQVEIGVLFGGSMILMLDALKKNNCKHKIIGIDPLDGFYIRDNKDYSSDRDIVTNLPINLSTVEGNIIKCGFSPDDVMIIKDYSESKKAISAVSQYRICSIWLDGNHSYKGLKEDFNNYFPLIAPGGYILIDNYKDSHWLNRFHPGVTKFIECDLIPPTEAFQIILIHNRNFIIRKIKR